MTVERNFSTRLSSGLHKPSTQEFGADLSAAWGFLTGGGNPELQSGQGEGLLLWVSGWVSEFQVSVYSKCQVTSCQQSATSTDGQFQSTKPRAPLLPAAGSQSREGTPKE